MASPELKSRYLPNVGKGKAIAAFRDFRTRKLVRMSPPLKMTAEPDGNAHVRLNGNKTWISNGGIADHYVVFARTGEAPGARGLSAFMVDADTPGLSVEERIEVIAPHPLATLRFDNVRVPVTNRSRCAGRRLQGGDVDAGYLPLDGRRRRARLRAPCAA